MRGALVAKLTFEPQKAKVIPGDGIDIDAGTILDPVIIERGGSDRPRDCLAPVQQGPALDTGIPASVFGPRR